MEVQRVSDVTILQPEIVDVLPDDDLWELIFETWAFRSNRNVPRTVALLTNELEGSGNILPRPGAIRQRISRENWKSRALLVAASGKELDVKRVQQSYFELLRMAIDWRFELHANGHLMDPLLRRDLIVSTDSIIKGSGIGAYGAHSGGLMDSAIDDIHAVDPSRPLSITERQNRLMRKREEENR